jgi:hypothetical protein
MVQPDTMPTKGIAALSPWSEPPRRESHGNQNHLGAPDSEQQIMTRKLWKSDELIKQLKHIVKAQHGKIEEYRERLDSEPLGMVKTHMANQDITNFKVVKDDNEELRRQCHRARGELERVKQDNDTLRKANNRMKRMMEQQ